MVIDCVSTSWRYFENNIVKDVRVIDSGRCCYTRQTGGFVEKRRHVCDGSAKRWDAKSAQNGKWNNWSRKQDANRVVLAIGS